MIEIGNRTKWTTGALSLLALMVLGYSGIKLSLLYDTPLVGVSSESKLAKRKWNQLKNLISEKEKKDWSKSVSLLIKDIHQGSKKETKSTSSQEIQQVVRYSKEILPEISGIIVVSGSMKISNTSVIIQGKVYSENDEVSGYMIKKITGDGVSFIKDGHHYYVDAPDTPYSVNKGN